MAHRNVCDSSRMSAPSALRAAPVSSVPLNHRSSAAPAGSASTTYRSGNTCASQPTAFLETPKSRATSVSIGANVSHSICVAITTAA